MAPNYLKAYLNNIKQHFRSIRKKYSKSISFILLLHNLFEVLFCHVQIYLAKITLKNKLFVVLGNQVKKRKYFLYYHMYIRNWKVGQPNYFLFNYPWSKRDFFPDWRTFFAFQYISFYICILCIWSLLFYLFYISLLFYLPNVGKKFTTFAIFIFSDMKYRHAISSFATHLFYAKIIDLENCW